MRRQLSGNVPFKGFQRTQNGRLKNHTSSIVSQSSFIAGFVKTRTNLTQILTAFSFRSTTQRSALRGIAFLFRLVEQSLEIKTAGL